MPKDSPSINSGGGVCCPTRSKSPIGVKMDGDFVTAKAMTYNSHHFILTKPLSDPMCPLDGGIIFFPIYLFFNLSKSAYSLKDIFAAERNLLVLSGGQSR